MKRGAALALAAVLAGCGSGATRPNSAADTTSAPTTPVTVTTPTTRPAPTTTTSTTVPRLPAPTPITGSAPWVRSPGSAAIYTTTVTPPGGGPAVGVAWIDTRAVRLALYAGYSEPSGTWPNEGSVPVSQQRSLLAAFNSGFKIYSYDTGWYEAGRTAMTLRTGSASLVIYKDGSATVGQWGRDVSLTPQVEAVRQNLDLLVDGGRPVAAAADPSAWGAMLHGTVANWRSGVGVTSSGALVYVGGPDLLPATLASILVAAHAVRAMELDVNPSWVSFSLYAHAGGKAGQPITSSANLVSGMSYSPAHYLAPFSRDFFAVFAR